MKHCGALGDDLHLLCILLTSGWPVHIMRHETQVRKDSAAPPSVFKLSATQCKQLIRRRQVPFIPELNASPRLPPPP